MANRDELSNLHNGILLRQDYMNVEHIQTNKKKIKLKNVYLFHIVYAICNLIKNVSLSINTLIATHILQKTT